MRSKILTYLVFSWIFISCNLTEKKQSKPNVILFLVDDLGWKDLSGYGSSLYQTPNVDQLASSGVKFTDAYAACTVCSPTRASILTGKYPARIHCTDWISGHKRPYAKLKMPDWTQYIRPEDLTLAEVLKSKGYKTYHVGKWHLGEEEKHWPEYHGFDQNIGGWKMGMPRKIKKNGGYFTPYNNPRLSDGPEGEYLTERLTNETINIINSQAESPFFINLWLYNVHTPLQAKQNKIDKYQSLVHQDSLQSNATYAAMVEHMDDALGKVVEQLKKSGIYENTIIIFASDNGGLIGNKGNESLKPKVTSNSPLRSGKGDLYEGGVRTPFIVSWPGKIAPGRTTDILTVSVDIFPTVLGLAGFNTPTEEVIDGVDLSDFLFYNQRPERGALFWHYPHYHTEGAVPHSAVRKGDWKYIVDYENQSEELYNLNDDIGERVNLVSDYTEKAWELRQLLDDWLFEVGAQMPTENPDFDSKKADKWKSGH